MAMRQAGWRVSGSQLAAFTASLLAIANPIANLALFESMTGDNTPAERRKIAATALAAVIVTLAVVTWAGEAILDLFGISIGALEIAGGSILVTIAFQMVHGQESGRAAPRTSGRSGSREDRSRSCPSPSRSWPGRGRCRRCWCRCTASPTQPSGSRSRRCAWAWRSPTTSPFGWPPPPAALGQTGVNVVTRIMGVLLLAIAVGMLVSGLQSEFPGLSS